MTASRRAFDNEWVLERLETHQTFFTKRMFGGLAAYLFGRMMLVLVEPTSTGRWTWHGVLVCTDHAHQPSIRAECPALEPHQVLRKWLYIESTHPDFESTMERVAACVAKNDARFGILPAARERRRRRSRQTP